MEQAQIDDAVNMQNLIPSKRASAIYVNFWLFVLQKISWILNLKKFPILF
jgi:hypothetical protein